MCGRGFGWGNGRGLVGCDWISHHVPIAFSFPEILHATPVSTNTVLIQSLMYLRWCTYEYFCLPVDYHRLSTHFDFHWQYSSQERPTNILATLPLVPLCTDGGKVVSTLIILTDIARSTPQHGHQVMCIKWNKPLATYNIHRVRVGLAARSVVYTRIYN